MGYYQNSATAASNTTVNGIGSAGSSSANLIDDLIRELAAQGRQFANDLGGNNTVGGTADAITITPSSGSISAAYNGLIIGFTAGGDNTTTTPTANVGGLGAEPIKKAVAGAEGAVVAGDIKSGGFYWLRWRSAWDSAGGAWELLNAETIVATIVKGEGTATTNLPQGLAKAWANLNGTGTIALRDSLNMSSVTDNQVGSYTFTMSSAMSNGLYSIQATAQGSTVSAAFPTHNFGNTPSTTAYDLGCFQGNTREDATYMHTGVHGDLA